MTIEQLTKQMEYELLAGSISGEADALVYDSRKLVPGCVFVCIRGAAFDGHEFAAEAAEKQAAAIVVERDVQVPPGPAVLKVADTRLALAELSAAWFHYPARELVTIGVTGTKGKTTTTYMIKSILESTGHKVGLIGTIEAVIGKERIPAANTTPESYLVQQYFRRMADAGCDTCVMEVSSQGLKMHRVGGFVFDIGIFTNLEPDHIGPNEHASFEEYLACKAMLFRQCKTGIVNIDDAHAHEVMKGHTCSIETYGIKTNEIKASGKKADLWAQDIRLVQSPGCLGVAYHAGGLYEMDVEVDVPGMFSVYNSLAAIAVCRHFGIPRENMEKALKQARVKGRIEMVKVSDDFTLMIDYAHNAMSLKSLLQTLREYQPGRLVCLFGCGGNRSRLRRYEMGEVSGNLADLTIITSDNPRYEEPQAIIDDIKQGIAKTDGEYVEIIDRKEAIRYAITHGRKGDVIVLAGKGHEDYQEIRGKKYPMDERVLIAEILAEQS